MKKYRHIICPIDFSECSENALKQALTFQEMSRARLTLIHFVEPWPVTAYNIGPVNVQGNMTDSAEKSMDEIATQYSIDPEDTRVLINNPRRGIASFAQEVHGDLIIIGSHGHHGIITNLLGSTASSIVNRAYCDVFIVKAP